MDKHEIQMKAVKNAFNAQHDQIEVAKADILIQTLPTSTQRTINRVRKRDCSTWLSMIPTQDNQFYMNVYEFRDSIALRYGQSPINMQGFCDGCSQPFDISHVLDCKVEGLIGARHNESRGLNIDLINLSGLTQSQRTCSERTKLRWKQWTSSKLGSAGFLGIPEGSVV